MYGRLWLPVRVMKGASARVVGCSVSMKPCGGRISRQVVFRFENKLGKTMLCLEYAEKKEDEQCGLE